MKLFLIRHAQTNANSQGLTQGSGSNEPLSELGQRQALATAEVIQKYSINLLLSSPSKRAVQTAEAISKSIRLPIEVRNEMTERNWGDWNMEPWTETQEKIAALSVGERYSFMPPHGESEEQMTKRLQSILRLLINTDTQGVVIVTHLAILRILIPLLTGKPLEEGLGYSLHNASITTLERNGSTFELKVVGDTSHLGD